MRVLPLTTKVTWVITKIGKWCSSQILGYPRLSSRGAVTPKHPPHPLAHPGCCAYLKLKMLISQRPAKLCREWERAASFIAPNRVSTYWRHQKWGKNNTQCVTSRKIHQFFDAKRRVPSYSAGKILLPEKILASPAERPPVSTCAAARRRYMVR